jgi:hypothetical protein
MSGKCMPCREDSTLACRPERKPPQEAVDACAGLADGGTDDRMIECVTKKVGGQADECRPPDAWKNKAYVTCSDLGRVLSGEPVYTDECAPGPSGEKLYGGAQFKCCQPG